jgi:hypothetical protein
LSSSLYNEHGIAGTVYADYINEQLKDEQTRKTSLEQRGFSVIASSGVLITLLLGLVALLAEPSNRAMPTTAKALIVAAISTFLFAALFGLAVNLPCTYQAMAIESLKRMATQELWVKPDLAASWRIAEQQVHHIDIARKLNGRKANLLHCGIVAQTVGVVLAAAGAVYLMLA